MSAPHYQITALAGLLVAARLDVHGEDATLAAVPLAQADALAVVAERVLRAAGHAPSAEDAAVFASAFLGQFADQRAGAKTLRGDIVTAWIAARRRRGGGAPQG